LQLLDEASHAPAPVWMLVAQARARYGQGQYHLARQLADSVLADVAQPEERTGALAVLAQACLALEDWERARDALAQLKQAGGDAVLLTRLEAELAGRGAVPVEANGGDDACNEPAPLRPEPRRVTFADVEGMTALKEAASMRIIQPFLKPEIFRKYGQSAGGGLLLYGPPGCGKTHFARAIAGECGAAYFDVAIEQMLDKWFGQSEQRLHKLFETARDQRPAVLFFDELDALARRRDQAGNQHWLSIVNTFLHELDGLAADNDGILVIGASNAPWLIDTAFKRPGRFDHALFVAPPDVGARAALIMRALADKPYEGIDPHRLAAILEYASCADLVALVDDAARRVLQEVLRTGVERAIRQPDMEMAAEARRPSTLEWLQQARNHVEFSNQSGQWDDVAAYLQIGKVKRWWKG
jgi:AAA+ superfamily predicted ATPase